MGRSWEKRSVVELEDPVDRTRCRVGAGGRSSGREAAYVGGVGVELELEDGEGIGAASGRGRRETRWAALGCACWDVGWGTGGARPGFGGGAGLATAGGMRGVRVAGGGTRWSSVRASPTVDEKIGARGCLNITKDYISTTNYVCVTRSKTRCWQVLIQE